MAPAFEGIFVPNITPFAGGAVDVPGLERVLRYLIDQGVDGVVPTGTTGETATLADAEKRTVWEVSVAVAGGRVPVIAGTGSNDTRHAVELTRMARDAGVDAVLVVAPYYNAPTQEGLVRHFSAVAASTDLPVLLYNIPGRTAVNIEPETTVHLSQVDNIVGIKESSTIHQMMAVIAGTEDFSVLCGEDALILGATCLGGHGAIAASAHVLPDQFTAMYRLAAAGRVEEARAIHYRLLPLVRLLFAESNPSPVKGVYELLHLCSRETRSPLVPATEDLMGKLRAAIDRLGVAPVDRP